MATVSSKFTGKAQRALEALDSCGSLKCDALRKAALEA